MATIYYTYLKFQQKFKYFAIITQLQEDTSFLVTYTSLLTSSACFLDFYGLVDVSHVKFW